MDSRWAESLLWKTRYRVLRTGPPTGVWQTESVDLVRDYREAFDSDPPDHAEGIGVMTDGDQTKSESIGDYDDFAVFPGPSK